MKSKTVKQVLRKKFDEFTNSIKDPKVKKLVQQNSIITGGAIASMLTREEVNDYDVYFTNKETVLAVCEYYIKYFKALSDGFHDFKIMDGTELTESDIDNENNYGYSPGRIKIRVQSQGVAVEDGFEFDEQPDNDFGNLDTGVSVDGSDNSIEVGMLKEPMSKKEVLEMMGFKSPIYEPFRPVYISANAITLSDDFQLIVRFFGDAGEIHDNYDFAHCTCWWTSADGHLEMPAEALECLLTKELRYKGSKYPLASIIRTRKFINRGFTINAGQYLKMALQLNDMDLRDLAVLEDQLIGVDALYFAAMIEAIPEDRKIDNKVDNNYLMLMIDRFF